MIRDMVFSLLCKRPISAREETLEFKTERANEILNKLEEYEMATIYLAFWGFRDELSTKKEEPQ